MGKQTTNYDNQEKRKNQSGWSVVKDLNTRKGSSEGRDALGRTFV
jgi:hypothetical protein